MHRVTFTTRRRAVASSLLFGCVVLGGCEVGPDYRVPTPADQPHRIVSIDTPDAEAAGIVSGVPIVREWWTTLQDERLNALVDSAVAANLDVKTAVARVKEARALRYVALAALYPNLSLSSGQGTGFGGPSNVGVAGTGRAFHSSMSYTVGLNANWPIDVWGGGRRGIEAADAALDFAVESRRDALVTLLAELGNDYIDLRTAQRQLDIAKKNVSLQEQTLKLVEIRRHSGLASDLEIAQALTQLDTTRATVPSFESSIMKSIFAISVLLGREPSALMSELEPVGPIPKVPPRIPVGFPVELLTRRPDVQKAERTMAQACANCGVEESLLFPQFALNGSIGYSPMTPGRTAGQPVFFAGPTVSWPIFTGFSGLENLRAADARLEQAVLGYEAAILAALQDTETSITNYSKELVRKDVLAKAAAEAERAEKFAEIQYKSGLVDFLNVITAEATLASAQNALAASEQSVLEDLVAVYKSLGGGWDVYERDLAERDLKDASTELPK